MVRSWSYYVTPTATQRRLGMVCLGAGHKLLGEPCPRRVLHSYAAVLIVDGAGWFEWGETSRRAEVTASTLFWLFPGVPHSYGPHSCGWQELWLLFEGSAATAYEDLGYLSRTEPVVHLSDPFGVRSNLDRLVEACRHQRPGAEVEAAHAVHGLILAAHDQDGGHRTAGDAAVLAALSEGACSPLSVHEHARRIGLSLSALRRAVHRSGGCSPKEYVLRVRLNRSKELLAETDLTVAEIGRRVGHEDPAYFTRMFTNRTGMPPSAFRRQQRRPRQAPAGVT
jgi:AraC-like DNA-binding protein